MEFRSTPAVAFNNWLFLGEVLRCLETNTEPKQGRYASSSIQAALSQGERAPLPGRQFHGGYLPAAPRLRVDVFQTTFRLGVEFAAHCQRGCEKD